MIKEISVIELKKEIDDHIDLQLIDVREKDEFDFVNLGSELIPMGKIVQNVDKIHKKKKVVIMCRSGKRSADVIEFLESNFGFNNLYNLKGGILAWSDEIDPSISKY